PRMNLIDAAWHGPNTISAGGAEIAGPEGIVGSDTVTVGLRPEHLVLSSPTSGGLAATVDFCEYLGGTRYLYCQLPDGQNLVAEQRDGDDLAAGATANFTWKPKDLRLFDAQGARLGV
ncbi:MAG TPA: TOBE domain-containing protein, partial [Devosia sp.]|nr:TOBE domain-containing protein [Devosia sp.]